MKFLILILLSIPSIVLYFQVFILENQTDPIKYIYSVTGITAFIILLFTTSVSMIRKYLNLVKYRAVIGLMGFYYTFLHFLNFIILDMELDFLFALKESLDKPFVYLGLIAFFVILFMAITSTTELFKKYNKYHKFLYLALILITIHFVMAQKSLSILQWISLSIIFLIGFFKALQLKNKLI